MHRPQHSTIASLFAGRPGARRLYEQVKSRIAEIGPTTIEVFRTQVSFAAGTRKFAWVWLPQMWTKKRPDDCIALSFQSPTHLPSPRFAEVTRTGPESWTHHLIIQQEPDIDDEVMNWLRSEYKRNSTQGKET